MSNIVRIGIPGLLAVAGIVLFFVFLPRGLSGNDWFGVDLAVCIVAVAVALYLWARRKKSAAKR